MPRPLKFGAMGMLLLACGTVARAADPAAPDEAFLEYLGSVDSESDDWTWFADHEDESKTHSEKTQGERTKASKQEDAKQPASHDR